MGRELASEQDKRGIDWSDELDEPHAFQVGLDAIDLTLRELVPRIGRPVAVQRKLEFKLTPDLEWTVQCYLDLETLVVVDDDPHAVPVPAIVDYKVKGTPLSQGKAAQDPQAGLYLAARWLHHDPAAWFAFAQIAKPGKRRKQMSAAFVRTTRTPGQLRGCLARVAQAASEIVAYYQRFGPDRPWGFADPTGWKCSHRYCHHHPVCPGGRGL